MRSRADALLPRRCGADERCGSFPCPSTFPSSICAAAAGPPAGAQHRAWGSPTGLLVRSLTSPPHRGGLGPRCARGTDVFEGRPALSAGTAGSTAKPLSRVHPNPATALLSTQRQPRAPALPPPRHRAASPRGHGCDGEAARCRPSPPHLPPGSAPPFQLEHLQPRPLCGEMALGFVGFEISLGKAERHLSFFPVVPALLGCREPLLRSRGFGIAASSVPARLLHRCHSHAT